MPYARPKLSDLKNLVARDLESSLKGSDALLRFSNVGATGKAQANLSHLHYGYLDWIAQMAVPYTAEDEFLEAWAGLKGVIRKAPTVARGGVTFPGNADTVIPAVTPVVRGDGKIFTTTLQVTVGMGGTVEVPVKAEADPAGLIGADGNTVIGSSMTLGVAISGVQSGGTVTTACAGGADIEKDDSLRSRMLAAFQKPAQGGSETDYLQWAATVGGVTRAWCKPRGAGDGTVVVYTMFDFAEAAHGGFPQGTNGVATGEDRDTPATGEQLDVADAIFPLQPVTALVYSCAPAPYPVDFTITGLTSASFVTRALIAAAIDGVFFLEGTATGGSVALSLVESAIAAISGTKGYVITVPAGNIATPLGYLPVRGTITYP